VIPADAGLDLSFPCDRLLSVIDLSTAFSSFQASEKNEFKFKSFYLTKHVTTFLSVNHK
jgi:hypothetical protein